MKTHRKRWTLIVGTVAIIALALMSWFAILSPRLSQAASVQASADQLQTANVGLQNQYNQGMTMAHEAPAAAAQAQALFATMPEQADLPSVIEQINQAAIDAGIPADQIRTITTSVPAPVTAGQGGDAAQAGVNAGIRLATMTVSISADGSQDELMKFLDNLQGLERTLLVDSTQFTVGAPKATGKAVTSSLSVNGTMFVLQSRLPDLVASVESLLPENVQGGASPAPATPGASPAPVPSNASPSPGPSSTPVPLDS